MAKRRLKRQSDSTRTVPFEGAGSSGDVKDRFRGVYKPGANKPVGGFGNPVEQIKALLKRKKKPKP